jgi:hypothetical protein
MWLLNVRVIPRRGCNLHGVRRLVHGLGVSCNIIWHVQAYVTSEFISLMIYMDGHGLGYEKGYGTASLLTWWCNFDTLVWWEYTSRSRVDPGYNSGHLCRWYLRVLMDVRTMHSSCRWWVLTLFSMDLWSSSVSNFVTVIICASIKLE